jgi:hypothetical protein
MIHKVSVIIPVHPDRLRFWNRIYDLYNSQDYPEKELIPVFGNGSIGEKLNQGCARATGSIILRMDDDDLYSPYWISRSVSALISSECDVTGLSSAFFCNHISEMDMWDIYQHVGGGRPKVCGATMAFWKSTWESIPFREISRGEDTIFCMEDTRKVCPHTYIDGFLAMLHGGNTCSHEQLIHMRKLSNDQRKALIDMGSIGKVFGKLFPALVNGTD